MFKRTQQYLSLSVVIVVLMAATTLVLTCQHYVNSRSKIVAMLKSLGASKVWIRRWLWTQVSLLFAFGSIAGVLIGMGLEFLLRVPLTDLLPSPLPSYGVTPFVMAIVSCGLIAIPSLGIPLTRLLNINAAAVMQSSVAQKVSAKRWWLVLFPVLPFLAAFASNIMVWIVLVSIAILFIALSAVSVLIIRWCRRLPLGTAFALAISRLNRSTAASGVQFGALALSLMLLATIWLVRTDLLSDWQRTLPDNAPNAFAVNISPFERESYLETLDNAEIERSEAYPIVRGRLSDINSVDAKTYAQGEDSSDALRRELNFTWGQVFPTTTNSLQDSGVAQRVFR